MISGFPGSGSSAVLHLRERSGGEEQPVQIRRERRRLPDDNGEYKSDSKSDCDVENVTRDTEAVERDPRSSGEERVQKVYLKRIFADKIERALYRRQI